VRSLFDHWRGGGCAAAGVPLVVNTQGWVKGMGLDLLTECLQHALPSHLLQVSAPCQVKKSNSSKKPS
jgi:polynucleotide 5'-kinase involved in rRNA processing